MTSTPASQNAGKVPNIETDGINMSSLCRTLARVLVNLDAGEYTVNMRQDTVLAHDAPSNQASEVTPARLSE